MLMIQIVCSSINHTIQIPITQLKYPCLPVGYYFPASTALFMEDYNIHTNHFRIPQRLPLTAVLIICRSIFERMQYLSYIG